MSSLLGRRSILASLLFAFLLPHASCAPKKGTATPADETRSLTSATSAQPQASIPAPPPPPVRVLFIGNSYTYSNGGIDAVLAALAASQGRPMECAASTSGGKTLQWHWEEGDARSAIARGGWDYVVLQDHSTRPIKNPQRMFEFARKFDAEVKSTGAETVFFMTWARFNEPENQIVIGRAYNKIADELGATVARVGTAWERVVRDTPAIKLHTDDRSHPTAAGTYLAACVFYGALLGESPEGLPAAVTTASGKSIELSPDDAAVLQRAAAAVTKARKAVR